VPISPFFPFRRELLLGVVSVSLLLAACSNDDELLSLTNDPTPIEDLQADDMVGSGVDVPFTTLDGGRSNFAVYAGSPLVINFFARTCAPCVREMPEFEMVFQQQAGTVAFVGISTDPRIEDAAFLVEQTGVTYDLGWDPTAEVFAQLGGVVMPTTVFVDAAGVVRETWSGVLTADELTAKIAEIT